MEQYRFTFERLEVWQVAKQALEVEIAERGALKGLPGELASQLERAMLSVVANIAEGAGRESRADQRRHYAIARGSANEAGSLVGIAAMYGALSSGAHEAIRSRLVRVVMMLNVMVRR